MFRRQAQSITRLTADKVVQDARLVITESGASDSVIYIFPRDDCISGPLTPLGGSVPVKGCTVCMV